MVKKARPRKISAQQRERDNARRRVIFFPDADMNDEVERVAMEEGFVHRLVGQDKAAVNVTAYFVWLHRQFMRAREERKPKAA